MPGHKHSRMTRPYLQRQHNNKRLQPVAWSLAILRRYTDFLSRFGPKSGSQPWKFPALSLQHLWTFFALSQNVTHLFNLRLKNILSTGSRAASQNIFTTVPAASSPRYASLTKEVHETQNRTPMQSSYQRFMVQKYSQVLAQKDKGGGLGVFHVPPNFWLFPGSSKSPERQSFFTTMLHHDFPATISKVNQSKVDRTLSTANNSAHNQTASWFWPSGQTPIVNQKHLHQGTQATAISRSFSLSYSRSARMIRSCLKPQTKQDQEHRHDFKNVINMAREHKVDLIHKTSEGLATQHIRNRSQLTRVEHADISESASPGQREGIRLARPAGIAETPGAGIFAGGELNRVADEVMTILEKRLRTERERRGIF